MQKLKAARRFNSQPKTKRRLSIAADDLRHALGETIFPTTRRRAHEVKNILKSGKHSEKPIEALEKIERLSDGPYIELFARERREGWDAWGNEV